MSSILISLSPNTEADDVALAAKLLFSPWRWDDEATVTAMEEALTREFGGVAGAVLTSSGRTALTAALRASNIGAGDEVIVQAFTCLAVPAAVQWAGARPVYADIDKRTFNLDPESVAQRITPHTKAIVVQHTFGIPGPLAELTLLAKQHGLLLIEDLAHGLGGTWQGKPLGTFGDIAVLSFGRDKMLSSVFGGAVISRNQDIATRARQQQRELPTPPSWWTIQQLLHPLLMSLVIPTYFFGGLGKVLLVAAQKMRLLSKAVSATERAGGTPVFSEWRMSPALAVLLAHQWTKRHRYLSRRRTIARRYYETLTPTWQLPGELSDAAWLRFPLLVSNPSVLRQRAMRQRMFLGDWYATPVAPCDSTQMSVTKYTPNSCPVAEHAAAHVLNLPTYPRLTDHEVDRVVTYIANNRDANTAG